MILTKAHFPLLSAHSMEEAEVLCDRLGIFVDGGIQCIGNPKEVLELLAFHHLNTTLHISLDNQPIQHCY